MPESAQARGVVGVQRVQRFLDASVAKAEVHIEVVVRTQLTTPTVVHVPADHAVAPRAPIMLGEQSTEFLKKLEAFSGDEPDDDDDL